ncbi:MAG: hypothetical protein V2B18_21415 [Pseudomonadota bacterium]
MCLIKLIARFLNLFRSGKPIPDPSPEALLDGEIKRRRAVMEELRTLFSDLEADRDQCRASLRQKLHELQGVEEKTRKALVSDGSTEGPGLLVTRAGILAEINDAVSVLEYLETRIGLLSAEKKRLGSQLDVLRKDRDDLIREGRIVELRERIATEQHSNHEILSRLKEQLEVRRIKLELSDEPLSASAKTLDGEYELMAYAGEFEKMRRNYAGREAINARYEA